MASQHDEPASKGDLDVLGSALRTEMQALGSGLRSEMGALGGELRAEMRTLDGKLSADIRAVGVMVEQLSSDMRALYKEGVESLRESLERRITEVEQVVQANAGELRAEVTSIRVALDRRDERLEDLERRITVVEKHLGIR